MQMQLDTYRTLSARYYDLTNHIANREELAFFFSYAPQGGRILEPMCGTGNFLIPFMQAGYDIAGFDASDNMLNLLNQKCAALGLSPHVWAGFVQEYNRPELYDYIFIPSSSFGLITNLDEAFTSLQLFKKHLQPNGYLVFDADTLNAVPPVTDLWRRDIGTEDHSAVARNTRVHAPIDNVVTVDCRYELIQDGKAVLEEQEDFKLRLYEPEDMIKLLKKAGFSRVRAVKAYDRLLEPDTSDRTVVYECQP